MKEVHIYIELDDASGSVTIKHFGYVLEFRKASGGTETIEGFGRLINTNHAVTLWAIICAMERITQPCDVTIHARNTYITNMIEKYMKEWAESDFLNSREKPVAHRREWEHLWELQKKHVLHVSPGKHGYSSWLKTEIKKWKEEERCQNQEKNSNGECKA